MAAPQNKATQTLRHPATNRRETHE